ncbi:MAG: glycosyltransferase [Clostridiales bacterium]|jgi:glycosyltransferase involved in cell wall biosynthesis|nr:glycosyltransferase [Clostridiales bacterium]
MKKKIAFVNQRYGIEVNGGSEQYTREFAERLLPYYNVEVLTTCALEYIDWKNFYPEGTQQINGVAVRRFPVDRPRSIKRFNQLTERLLFHKTATEDEWINEQGPLCTKLIQFIKDNQKEYDVFIFVTYLYYLTVRGIGLVKNKSILIPTAHDEKPIYFEIYKGVFNAPRAIAFNTDEERELVYSIFRNQHIPSNILGVGAEPPLHAAPDEFRSKYRLSDYIIYVGRIDDSKGCNELFKYFIQYKESNPSDLKLVLIGKAVMPIPKHSDIISLGFVSEADKYNGISASRLLILPSLYESLSMSVLESLSLGIPVVVNGKSDVLRMHCHKSNAGLYYRNYREFEGILNYLFNHPDEYALLSENGRRYITANYNWPLIIGKLKEMIDSVALNADPTRQ